jgi:hypothetical protein
MTDAPRLRWFAYSLRTFVLVMTVLCIGLGWGARNLNQVRERERLFTAKDVCTKHPKFLLRNHPDSLPTSEGVPWSWSLFGAKPCRWGLILPNDRFTNDDLAHYREMFPEAVVVRSRFVRRSNPVSN